MLLIDEDMESSSFLSALKNAGIDYVQVKQALHEGGSDDAVIAKARQEGWTIVTNNGSDFMWRLLNQSSAFPSVIWTRTRETFTDAQIVEGIKSILEERSEKPNEFIAIITPQDARIRDLPIKI